MKGYNKWSYRPFRLPLFDNGDIHISRIAPDTDKFHIEWLGEGRNDFSVFYRKRGEGDFIHYGDTQLTECDIEGLESECEYEFYVSSGDEKSRVRLVRCGENVGVTVNYLHPEDQIYAYAGSYLGSPFLLRHPDGYMLATMDLFGEDRPLNMTIVFRSDDDGASWHYVSDIYPLAWAKLFLHNGDVYAMGCACEHGDVLIGRSRDGGMTFDTPVSIMRGPTKSNKDPGPQLHPQPILRYNGRIYASIEWGGWFRKEERGYCFATMVMSCDENADILDPENWSITEPRKLEKFSDELEGISMLSHTMEGALVVDREGRLLDITRFDKWQKAMVYEADLNDHEAMLKYSRLMDFDAFFSMFVIKYDPVSDYYYTVGTMSYDEKKRYARNLLSLMKSKDLYTWETVKDIFDYRHRDIKDVGFQNVSYEFVGDDLYFLVRTAMNGAHSFHDSNSLTFHKLKDFRKY